MEFKYGESLWDITIFAYIPTLLTAGVALFLVALAHRASVGAELATGWTMLVVGVGVLVGQLNVRPLDAGPAWSFTAAVIKVNMIASGLLLGAIGLVLLFARRSRRHDD
jgi:hypothetical protein